MDKVKHELDEALQEDLGPIPNLPPGDRRRDLSDVLGNTSKAAGFYSDAIPKHVHLKFVSRLKMFTEETSKIKIYFRLLYRTLMMAK